MEEIIRFLRLILRRTAIKTVQIEILIRVLFLAYILELVVAVYLSAHGHQRVNFGLFAIHIVVALMLFTSVIAEGMAEVIGRIFRKLQSTPEASLRGHLGWWLLFWLPLPLLWAAVNNTNGVEEVHFAIMALVPTVTWYWTQTTQSTYVRRLIGISVTVGIMIMMGYALWNTAENKAIDAEQYAVRRAVVAWFEEKANDKMPDGSLIGQHLPAVREVVGKLEEGETLTPGELQAWKTMEKMAGEKEPQKVDIKLTAGKLASGVRKGQVTNLGWLQEHWVAMVVAALGLAIAYKVFFAAPAVVVGAGGTAHGGQPATKSSRLGTWVILGLLGWSVYSINQGVGQPGKWWAEMSFDDHTIPVYIANFRPQVVCGLPPERKLKADDLGQWAMENTRNGANRMRSGFWYREAGTGAFQHASVSLVRVNETLLGQVFQTDARGCVTIDIVVSDADRAGSEILGPPVMRDGQWTYSLRRQPFIAMLRFHQP